MDKQPREANENFHFSSSKGTVVFALWGNLTKNPRFKLVEFSDLAISATLPKPILLSPLAVRFLYMTGPTSVAAFRNKKERKPLAPVGGIMFLDLMEMPDLAHNVNGWMMRIGIILP